VAPRLIPPVRPLFISFCSPGSGTVSTYLATLLGGTSADSSAGRVRPLPLLTLVVDVNAAACAATLATAAGTGSPRDAPPRVDAVRGDLALPLLPRLSGAVDVLLFNPPYVPTEDEEVPPATLGSDGVTADRGALPAAWAGGDRGRLVIDRVLPMFPRLLARPLGVAYLLLVAENEPREVAALLALGGLDGRIIRTVRAANELLHVLRVTWRE
jgi:release factor glutamine methyltransferase